MNCDKEVVAEKQRKVDRIQVVRIRRVRVEAYLADANEQVAVVLFYLDTCSVRARILDGKRVEAEHAGKQLPVIFVLGIDVYPQLTVALQGVAQLIDRQVAP